MLSFPARYTSRCPVCDEPIHEGDYINLADEINPADEGYRHSDCEEPSVTQAEPPVCTVCWLRHPIGACDRD